MHQEMQHIDRARAFVDHVAGDHENSVAGGPAGLKRERSFHDVRGREEFNEAFVVAVDIAQGVEILGLGAFHDGWVRGPVALVRRFRDGGRSAQ
jgi:hypothetical protein